MVNIKYEYYRFHIVSLRYENKKGYFFIKLATKICYCLDLVCTLGYIYVLISYNSANKEIILR